MALEKRQTPEANYPRDPIGYAYDILGIKLTEDQKKIIEAAIQSPFMVQVESGHNIGKTLLGAVLINWHYDSFDPGVSVTTAPTKKAVEDLLWAEVRMIRRAACGNALRKAGRTLSWDFSGHKTARMWTNEDHWAEGFTVEKGESFQGRHRERMLFIFDEAEGILLPYFTTTRSMFKADGGHIWITFCNPTTTTSPVFLESQKVRHDGSPVWKTFNMSAVDHPNIEAELKGDSRPIPNAVSVSQINGWVEAWCDPIDESVKDATDFEWPPKSGKWYRSGPIADARIFGRRPSLGIDGVWTMALWQAAERTELEIDLGLLPEIGVDCAWKGDDYTCFHIRWGGVSLKHESYNGLSAAQIAHRLKELCKWCADLVNAAITMNPLTRRRKLTQPEEIVCKIDDDATGGAVHSLGLGMRWVPIGAVMASFWQDRYPNKRSELWFSSKERAMKSLLSVKELPQDVRDRLRIQLLAVKWSPDAAGRRVVEKKDKTKETIGRSPDDADAFNLAYCEHSSTGAEWVDPVEKETEKVGQGYGVLGRDQEDPAQDYEPKVHYGIFSR